MFWARRGVCKKSVYFQDTSEFRRTQSYALNGITSVGLIWLVCGVCM